jgi:hypothetical protein
MSHNEEERLVKVELPIAAFDELERAYTAYTKALVEITPPGAKPAQATAWRALNTARRDLADAFRRWRDYLYLPQSYGNTAFNRVSMALRIAFDMASEVVEKDANGSRRMEIAMTSDDTGEEAIA